MPRLLERLAPVRQNRVLAALAALSLLFLCLSLLAHHPALAAWDRQVTLWLQACRSSALDRLVIAVTRLGDFRWLAALCLGVAAALLRGGRPWGALLCAATLLVFPLNGLLKHWVGRPRPAGDAITILLPAVGLSFPSGHAMSAAVVYGCVGLMAWLHLTRPLARWTALLGCTFLALAVGLSRVYLGVHWFSDVLGGWVAGLLLLLLLAQLHRRLAKPEMPPSN
jgi:undecaprenyl-diphosphatase